MNPYEELIVAFLFVSITILVFYIFRKLLEKRKRKSINDSTSAKSGHYWTRVSFDDRGFYCAWCKTHLYSGYECDYCTLKVDEVSLSTIQIPGNIDSDKFCFICNELCGGGVTLQDFACCFCWRVIHTSCMMRNFSEDCDFGPYRYFTLPPTSICTKRSGKRTVIERVILPEEEDFKPIITLVNTICGSCTGRNVYRSFLRHLHPRQVIDIQKENIKAALQWIEEHPEVLVVAGGDGTISIVAILPLGTGNDLSRVLGWGAGTNGEGMISFVFKYLNDVFAAEVQKLDRWNIIIKSKNQVWLLSGVLITNKRMTNYVSIGVDASVTFGMQSTRKSIPRAMSSRFLNKFLFFSFGTKDVFTRTCKGLRDKISLYLDGRLVKLPEIEGLVFLNIHCWGAGVQPWKYAEGEYPQKLDDGIFEVFAVTSSFHIAQMQPLIWLAFIGRARLDTLVASYMVTFGNISV
ncbi:unnamed protein product [Angiostrongylus costaricensis]|uniref:Diacylglycerol kinase n=1 Tax=Angiostrongylus costaricensis TaxID=334426 RepID=A0A158PJI7_ANGCS|nr:unnamed protein product [Angiostrongylus costaricensis]